jgi:hypothetical protein
LVGLRRNVQAQVGVPVTEAIPRATTRSDWPTPLPGRKKPAGIQAMSPIPAVSLIWNSVVNVVLAVPGVLLL